MNKIKRYYEDPVFNKLVNTLKNLSEDPHHYGIGTMIDAFLMSQMLRSSKKMRRTVYPPKDLVS